MTIYEHFNRFIKSLSLNLASSKLLLHRKVPDLDLEIKGSGGGRASAKEQGETTLFAGY